MVVAPITTDVVAGFHVKVKGPVPIAVAVADPLAPPKQVIELEVTLTVGPDGFDNDVTKLFVQPAPSITSKVYVPAPSELAVVTGPATTEAEGGVHVNWYPAPVPPEAVAEITPFDKLQPVGLVDVNTTDNEGFEAIVNVEGVSVQPLRSVILIL